MIKKKSKKPTRRAIKKKTTVSSKVKSQKKLAPKKVVLQKPIGVVTHYYTSIKVGIVKFKKDVRKGVVVLFKGATTNFSQVLDSMQYDHKDVTIAKKGKQIGIKVKKRVREGDKVFEG